MRYYKTRLLLNFPLPPTARTDRSQIRRRRPTRPSSGFCGFSRVESSADRTAERFRGRNYGIGSFRPETKDEIAAAAAAAAF